MIIVKDGLNIRKYYTKTSTGVEYKEFAWVEDWGKYAPNYKESVKLEDETWEEFKLRMRKQGFLSVEEVKEKGTYR